LSAFATVPGTYNYRVEGFATVAATYTITSTLTKFTSSTPSSGVANKEAVDVVTVASSDFALFRNYPNPFNPETNISYRLSTDAHVTLRVFDVLGREVATLVRNFQKAGLHSVRFSAGNLPSGIYFYRIEAGDATGSQFTKMNKMVLIK
ncbi:MAG: T9SS type A sorting domain-containing protein, partial [Ignavibacteriales bacterium]|nr:T9SS type A sorting domain-containing protein [Ignavibacteriales bacterium]